MPNQPSRIPTLLLCLLVAIVIWFMNELNKDGYVQEVTYPVQISYDDSAYIPVSPLPKNFKAILNGNGWTLLQNTLSFASKPVIYTLSEPDLVRQIDIEKLATLMAQQIKDVKIVKILGDTLNLNFERRATKQVQLKVDSSSIDLDDKIIISSVINLTPTQITVSGPISAISQIPNLMLIRIPAKRIRLNYDESLPLPYPKLSNVKMSAESVLVSFEVAELLGDIPADPLPIKQK
jgi:hypothetical protein